MENLEIKVCLVTKYIDILPGVEYEKMYVAEKNAYIKVCLILNGIAYDLDSDLEFPILGTDDNGNLTEEAELGKYYVYRIFDYGKVYLNDQLIYEPSVSDDKLYRIAYSKYLKNKNVVSYEKFLKKKREKR